MLIFFAISFIKYTGEKMVESQRRSSLLSNRSIVHTVAQLKGRRLRMARALTGFSRQELYERIGIATSTIDTWESGRVELTEKSADRVCEAFKKVGIHCSSEWLLTGAGNPPRMMQDVEKSIFSSFREANVHVYKPTVKDSLSEIPLFLDEDVRRELSFFVGIHKNALFHIVEEDFMNSRYKKSDCVAGEVEDLRGLEGSVIIAQLVNGKTILCKLLRNVDMQSEIFFGKNTSNESVRIVRAAEVIWHRMSKRKR
ncbi:MAG: helix-turn-helix domain-containing protein [Holosporaceae bacterium]|jgi:transcriptional regulator with XRE-family HTH domain|nr:helix-turn-helix domain-containing protein [Holosporaceae bacterium]